MLRTLFFGTLVLYVCASCSSGNYVQVDVLHTNDVYEISPLEQGRVGGMARVSQLKKKLLEKNQNTISVMAGDFLNPSVFGSLRYKGTRILGKQMVEVMNSAGIDLVTFGNHEFDLKEGDLLKRINESEFDWIIANATYQKDGNSLPFPKNESSIQPYQIQEYKNPDGKTVKVAWVGVCLDANQPDYVKFEDPIDAFKRVLLEIKGQYDVLIALTHLSIEQDRALAKAIPDIDLILGGHEHDAISTGEGTVRILKADANAKTAYVHQMKFTPKTKKLKLKSKLVKINPQLGNEPSTQKVVDKWTDIASNALVEAGLNPDEVITTLNSPLDARESAIRNRPTRIGQLIAKANLKAYPEAQGAILNTGSIRIDDVLEGQITEYDIARILPFGGAVFMVEMTGDVLLKTLSAGRIDNVGKGGFLALAQLSFNPETKTGTIQGNPIRADETYKIALPAFLLTGRESNLDFLTRDNPGISNIVEPRDNPDDIRSDIRLTLIHYLENNPIE